MTRQRPARSTPGPIRPDTPAATRAEAGSRRRWWRLVAYAWAAPCTALGLLAALPALAGGARGRRVSGVLELAWPGAGATHPRWLPFHALTLGHVVLGTSTAALARLRAHELAHVRQCERWGPAFLLAYPAESLWQACRGRRPYWDNRFEVQARAAADAAADATAARAGLSAQLVAQEGQQLQP